MSNVGIWGSGYYPNCYLEVATINSIIFFAMKYHIRNILDVLGHLLERDSCCLILVSITTSQNWPLNYTGKNNRFPFLDILAYLKNTTKILNLEEWDKSQLGNLVGNSLVGTCLTLPNLGFLWVFFKYPKISKNGNPLFFPVLNHLIWVADYRRSNCS